MKKLLGQILNRILNFRLSIAICLLALCVQSASSACAQETEASKTTPEQTKEVKKEDKAEALTPEKIQAQIDLIEKETSLDKELQGQILTTYKLAMSSVQKIIEYRERTTINREALKSLAEKVEKLKQALAKLPDELPLEITEEMDSKQLQKMATEVQGELRDFEVKQAQAEQATKQRSQDREIAVKSQATYAERLQDLQKRISAPPPAGEPMQLTQAIKIQNQSQLNMLNEEFEAVKEELNRFDAEKNARLLFQELELYTRKVELQKKLLKRLQKILTDKKLVETNKELKELKKEESIPLLQRHIEDTTRYTETIRDLIDRTKKIQEKLSEVNTILDSVSKSEQKDQETDRSPAGKSQVFALSLLRQLYELPNITKHRSELKKRRSVIIEATYQQIELRAAYQDLINIDGVIEKAKPKIHQDLEKDGIASLFAPLIEKKLRNLLIQKREAIENLESTYSNYLDTLTALDASQNSLVSTVDDYRNFIRQRIFWIRSDKTIGLGSLSTLAQPATYPFSWEDVRNIFPEYQIDLQKNYYIYTIAIIVWLMLILLRVQAGQELTSIASQVQRSNYANIVPTLRAIFLTAIIAAPGPLFLLFAGWRLGELKDENVFCEAFSKTLILIGAAFAILEFFRQSCRRHGLVDSHFNGPNVLSTRVQRHLLSFTLIVLPLFFVVTLLNRLSTDLDRHVLGRLFFIAGMIICSVYANHFVNPRGPLMRELFLLDQSAYFSKTRWIWYPFVTLFPLLLAGMAWVGYYYTASQLAWRFMLTILLLVSLLFFWALATRWFRIAQRWFRIYVLREQRQKPRGGSQTIESQRQLLAQEEESNDEKREQQAMRLINFAIYLPLFVGLWMIWADTFPAIEYLNQISLWQKIVQQEVAGADGGATIQTVREAVTLIDLGIALFVCIATISLSRNLPGMIDFSILQRIGLDDSLRYALTSVIGYFVTIAGGVYVFNLLGFRWEQIQWLAAALTFGLSFGLQDIFANFISGLIILFERPIRIGDVVTIDAMTGIVTKIRIRASTVTDWDRKEYLVPNKEIITGRLLNWTLSDTLNRLVIPVGVAYGTDTEKVRQLLFEVARQEPEVLDEPAALVTFQEFGDSALNFVMRAYLGSMDNRMETLHRLHTAINQKFAEAGVEIAFPQQDLHLRTVPPHWTNPVQ